MSFLSLSSSLKPLLCLGSSDLVSFIGEGNSEDLSAFTRKKVQESMGGRWGSSHFDDLGGPMGGRWGPVTLTTWEGQWEDVGVQSL